MTNTVTLPQTIFKRLEKISASSRISAASIVRQAVQDRLDYEEWKEKKVRKSLAGVKAGKVYGKEEFWARLEKAKNERKKAA